MTNEQHQLLMYIDQISFALDDTVLFLDTHPCDTEALAYYQELKEEQRWQWKNTLPNSVHCKMIM